jgi:signal transduction histidine kinase
MAALPEKTREMLELASCIGSRFDIGTLSIIAKMPVHEVAGHLRPAIDGAIVAAISGGFSQMAIHEFCGDCCPMEHARQVELCFVHDRFADAAYQRLSAERKKAVHLALGRLLHQSLPKEQLEDEIFSVVRHFTACGDILTDEDERLQVAKLQRIAAIRAQGAAAFDAARRHYCEALALLPDNRWQRHYELTYELAYALYKTQAMERDAPEEMLVLGEELITHARSLVDRVRAMGPYTMRLTRAGQLQKALSLGIGLLRESGIELDPLDPRVAIRDGHAQIQKLLAGRAIESLAELPDMTDPLLLAQQELLESLLLSLYMGRRELVPLDDLWRTKLAIEHGTSPQSGLAFVGYGKLLAHLLGEFDAAYQFGQLARAVVERTGVGRSGANAISAMLTDWIKDPLPTVLQRVRASYRMGLESGETLFAGLAAVQFPALAFSAAAQLDQLAEECLPYVGYIEANMGDMGMREIHVTLRAIAALRGERPPTIFDSDEEKEAVFARMQQGNSEAIHWSYLLWTRLQLLLGDHDEAARLAEEVIARADRTMGQFAQYDSVYHAALALASSAIADIDRVASLAEELQRFVNAGAAINLRHKLTLLEAELFRLREQSAQAGAAYERAILQADEAGNHADQALANELAGRHYLARGLEKVARVYLLEARYCYEKWGAIAKVAQLDKTYSWLLSEAIARSRKQTGGFSIVQTSSATSLSGQHMLDFAAVLKASQALSREMDLAPLLRKLLGTLAQAVGAERVCLALGTTAATLKVHAALESDVIRLPDPPQPIDESDRLSLGIARYATRTRETVVLADAAREGAFRSDPYVSRNQTRSLVCMPLTSQGNLMGVLYLENNLTSEAFSAERLQVVELLAAQAAISIENARLFDELARANRTLEQKVAERTRDLVHKNTQLNESLDEQKRMQQQLLISEKMASLGNLVAGVAHEINTPVGAMVSSVDTAARAAERLERMVAEALASDKPGEPTTDDRTTRKRERLFKLLFNNHSVIATAGERVNEIVRTLRNFARLDEAEVKRANIHEGIDSTLSLARHRLKQGISVVKEYGELPEITCYPNQLNQVFMNLLVNAIDAIEQRRTKTPDSDPGQVTIRTRCKNGEVQISFGDNGSGIAPDVVDKIFNPGYTTKGVGVGTGLGLSIVFNIIEKHRGRVEVESSPGKGSTFTVHLPVDLTALEPISSVA